MEDLFKKFIYTGVGLVSTTAEKMQKTIDELVDKGRLSKEEGKQVVDDLFSDTEGQKADFEDRLRGLVDKALGRFDFPTRAEVRRLNERIAELEGKLDAKEKATEKKAAPKRASTRKPAAKKEETPAADEKK